MIDALIILTPLLLLAIVALLGFIGCGELHGVSAVRLPSLQANPQTIGAGRSSTLNWDAGTEAKSASIDQGIGTVYTFDEMKPDAPTTGSVSVSPGKTTQYTLSATDQSGALINVSDNRNIATVTVSVPKLTGPLSPPSGPTTGGTNVTIQGQQFGMPVDVKFGITSSLMVNPVSDVLIVAQTPPLAPSQPAGPVDVTVTNPDGQSATLPKSFTYVTASPGGGVVHLLSVLTGPVFNTTVSASLPAFAGAGKLIVVTFEWGGTATVALSSTPAVTFTQIQADNLNPQQVVTFIAQNVSGAVTVTAKLSAASSTEVNLVVSAYDNVAPGSIPDKAAKTQGTGTALNLPFSTTALSAGDLIYAIAVTRNGGAVLVGSISPGMTPSFVGEAGQGSYLLLEDYNVTAADLASPNINVAAVNAAGNATSLWYLFAMRIKHA